MEDEQILSRGGPEFRKLLPREWLRPTFGIVPRPAVDSHRILHHYLRLHGEREDAMEDRDVEHQPTTTAGEFLLPNLREAPDFVAFDERAVD